MTNSKTVTFTVVFLLTIFVFLSIGSMLQQSPVCDEVSHHIATGYSFLKTRDFRLNSAQPPLVEELSALPLLLLNPRIPLEHPSWDNIDRSTFGFQFLYKYNNNAGRIVFWSRIPIVIISILGSLLVFMWAKKLYGAKAGLFALFLYVFCQNILAYSYISTSDMGVSVFILLALYLFSLFISNPSKKYILLSGIALGLAEAAKLTALILIPLFFAITIYKSIATKKIKYILGFLIVLTICYFIVFATYFGEIKPLLKNNVDVAEKIQYIEKFCAKFFPNNTHIKNSIINFSLNTPIPFSTYIMTIFSSINMIFRQHIFTVFLLGKYSQTGWAYYYPLVFLFKTPIPLLVFLITVIFFSKRLSATKAFQEKLIILFMLVFSIAALSSKLQLGMRYILPLFPCLFIYISKIVNLQIKPGYLFRCLLVLLCSWYVIENFMTYPYYMSYVNQFAGGPANGWKYLRDSNVDHGQDLPALAKYVKENNIQSIRLSYFGTADPAYYGIKFEQLKEEERIKPGNSVYAISVNYIDTVSWTKNIKPAAKAGYSIFIYDFRK